MIDLKHLSLQGKYVDAFNVPFGMSFADGCVPDVLGNHVAETLKRHDTSDGDYVFYVILARLKDE